MMIFDFEGIAIRRRRAQNLKGGADNRLGECIGKTFAETAKQASVHSHTIRILTPKSFPPCIP